jgi:putative transposase
VPRHQRISPDGFVQHVINRGDHRETIFHKPADFRAFLAIVAETAYRIPIRILAYCIMRNHFHLLLWPYQGRDVPHFMQLLMNTHIRRYILHYRPAAPGHIYQGRYKNPLVETGEAIREVARYIERNALDAGLVKRAEHYKWSSAWRYVDDPGRPTLAAWPVERPRDWLTYVNTPTSASVLKQIRRSAQRGAPYGEDAWVQTVATAHGLESTLRPQGRPRVYETFLPTA